MITNGNLTTELQPADNQINANSETTISTLECNGPGSSAPNEPVSLMKRIARVMWEVAKWAFKALIGVALFVSNPSFFTVGFLAGIILNEQMKAANSKIKTVWGNQPWGISILVGIGAFFALPITLAASSFLFASNLGTDLFDQAFKENKNGQQTTPMSIVA